MRRAWNGLRQRHVAFLTIGGTIGGGLFLGVGQGIRTAGPAMMLAFLVAGAAVLVVARCLGDMALAAGGTATFVRTTRLNLGRRTAFVEGWSYWVCAILTCMAELAAAGVWQRTASLRDRWNAASATDGDRAGPVPGTSGPSTIGRTTSLRFLK